MHDLIGLDHLLQTEKKLFTSELHYRYNTAHLQKCCLVFR